VIHKKRDFLRENGQMDIHFFVKMWKRRRHSWKLAGRVTTRREEALTSGGKARFSSLCIQQIINNSWILHSPACNNIGPERKNTRRAPTQGWNNNNNWRYSSYFLSKKCYWRAQISKSSRNAAKTRDRRWRKRENDRGNIPSGKDTQIFGINFSVPTTKIFGSEKGGNIDSTGKRTFHEFL